MRDVLKKERGSYRQSVCALMLGTSLATVAIPTAAFAADEAEDGANPSDIIVTAQKREQRLNDVGLTVAVVSGAQLKERQVFSLADLAATVPSVSYTESAYNTPVYTVRGVGFYETSISAYPTVSLYLDEVPLAFPVLSRHSAFDLERVELLKGPQGTLFGQNATGGAINFIAAKPTNDLHAGLDVSYGRYNAVNVEGFVSGPLADNVKARFAGRVERANGWQVSQSRPNDKNGKIENYMGRLLLDIAPTDRLRLQINLNGWKDQSETQAPQFIALYPQIPIPNPGVTDAPFTRQSPRAAEWTPGLPFGDSRMLQGSVRADLDLSDDVTLSSITSYTDYRHHQSSDQDGLVVVNTDVIDDSGHIRSLFQELRLANSGSDRFRWVAGANYERSRTVQRIRADFPRSSPAVLFSSLGYTTFNTNIYTDFEHLQNYAAFGNVEYDVGRLTLKAGGRYTKAKRTADICNVDPTSRGVGAFIAEVLLGGASGPYVPGTCYPFNNLGVPSGSTLPGQQGRFSGNLSEDNISWRAGLDWRAAPGILTYANVAKGYKAGSFPTLAAGALQQYLPVTQESVLSYEAGFKATLLDHALQLNGAAFYYDYKDKQIRAKDNVVPFGLLDTLQNVPKSQIKGFELEANIYPTPGLTIGGNFVFLDAKITEFTSYSVSGVIGDLSGSRIPFTPKYQVGINSDYVWRVSEDLKASVGTSINFRSSTVSVIGGDVNPAAATPQTFKLFQIDDYTLVDARASIGAENDRWKISLYGKNIFNKYHWTNVATTTDTISRYAAQPASYGVQMSLRY